MTALLALPAVAWLWALLAAPGALLPGNPLDELLRQRLRAHRARLVAAAVWLSLLALLALALARPAGEPAHAARRAIQLPVASPSAPGLRGCFATPEVAPICWRLQADGSWAVEAQLDDGIWVPATLVGDGRWGVAGLVVDPGPYPYIGGG